MMQLIQHRFLKSIFACFLGIVVLGLAPMAFGQAAVSGTLVGTVTDSSGAAVVGAQVTATMTTTNISHTTTTNESGNYTFPNMPPGNYSIKVTAQGFQTSVQGNVDLLVNTSPRADFKLQPGAVTQSVVVNSTAAVLQTDTTDVTTNIQQHDMESMPLTEGRNFEGLLNLVPGATPAISERSEFFNAANTLQTQVNGMSQNFNLYQIEGVDDEEASGDLQIEIPPAEAIQSVSITTNNYDASLGTAVGAITNVTLKSGSNRFNGDAYWFIQNNAVNARSYFSGPLGHMSYNYVGGTIGGPIVKDKLFFFGSYLRTIDSEATANTLTVPTSQWITNAGVTPGCTDTAGCVDLSGALVPKGAGFAGQIYDPNSGDGKTTPRTPYPNNQIPYSQINPITLTMIQKLDAAAAQLGTFVPVTLANPSNNYFDNLGFSKDSNSYDTKFDYTPNASNHVTFRYSYQNFVTIQQPTFGPFLGGPAAGAFEGIGKQPTFDIGGSYDHIFSPTFFTQVRFGIAHLHNTANVSDYGTNDAEQLGIPGINDPTNPFTSGQVGVWINGDFENSTPSNGGVPIIGYSTSQDWERADWDNDLANSWAKIIGNHTINWGGELFRLHNDLIQPGGGGRGQYTFDHAQTSTAGATDTDANDMASWLFDVPTSFQRGVATIEPTIRNWYFALFANDKWQATPKLTVNYGLRWEDYRSATPAKKGGFASYNPDINAIQVAGIGSVPLNLGLLNDFHYFAPRTGIAYRVNNGLVVRAGAGVSYSPIKQLPHWTGYPVETSFTFSPTGNSPFTPAVLPGGTTTATFQQGFPSLTVPPVPADGIIPVTGSLLTSSLNVMNIHYRVPMVYSYNVAIEKAFGANNSVDVAYVGNHASRVQTSYNLNEPDFFGGGNASQPLRIKYGVTGGTSLGYIGTSSNYNALQVKYTKRFSSGFSAFSAFTWGKSLGYNSSSELSGSYSWYINPRRNYAPTTFDIRKNFEQTFSYALPFGRNHKYFNSTLGNAVVGGWQISGMISMVSGMPFTVSASGTALNTPGEATNATLNGHYHVLHGIGPGNQWFDKSTFSQPAGCTGQNPCTNPDMGNTGLDQFYGPGSFQDNFSLVKNFSTYHEMTAQLRFDAFQLSNTPQFGQPSGSLTSSSFGQVTSTVGSGEGSANGIGGGRSLEAGLKIMF